MPFPKNRVVLADTGPVRVYRNMLPFPVAGYAGSQRHCGRVRSRDLMCSLGEVLDISGGGMRVRSPEAKRFARGMEVDLAVVSCTDSFRVRARIAWMRRQGWRRGELGLTFLDLTPAARASLVLLAREVTQRDAGPSVDPRLAA